MPKRFKIHKAKPCDVGRVAPETTRPSDKALDLARKLRSTMRWTRASQRHRRAHPLCCDPLGDHDGQPVSAEMVHHVEPVWRRPDLLTDPANLASLCAACHGRIEAMEQSGRPTARLFKS